MSATISPPVADNVIESPNEKSAVVNLSEPSSTSDTKTPSVKSVASQKSLLPQTPGSAIAPQSHGPTKIPLTALSSESTPSGFKPLTEDQQRMYDEVLATVSEWTTVPESTARGAASSDLTADEKMFFTRECLLRYLRATKWKVPDALRRLQSTLSWRREYGADKFTADYISPENETGKQAIQGWDREGRPCLYLSPGKQNTKMSDRQMQHLSFMLDRTLDMLPPGQETTCLVINYKGAASGQIPSVGQAKAFLSILQSHNPERLGKALISSIPWYVSTFFKLISPFIDPVTRDKMKFSPDNADYIPREQLWNENGGDLDFTYDHSIYWPAMIEECQQRKQAYRERWVAGGSRFGESEEYLRGGAHKGLAASEAAQESTDAPTESANNETAEVQGLTNDTSKLTV